MAVPATDAHSAVPALSPAFDPDWADAGHIDTVLVAASNWLESLSVPGLTVHRRDLPGRTPLLLVDVPATDGATNDGTVLAYGHLDKQPEMVGWDDDLGPWTPVRKGDRLYGRGGADDGYSVYALGTALVALDRAGGQHGRIVGVIECSEESGSPDLPAHLDALGDELGSPELVVCLDSGCGDYERLWVTTSLRGLVSVDLRVDVLTEGVHSGAAGGIVPSSFRIARTLLDRIEASGDGRLLIDELFPDIPEERRGQATQSAETLGRPPAFPWAGGTHPATDDVAEQLLNRTWGPALEVIGADGLPPLADAGNVARPTTTLGLSIRIPPGPGVRTIAKVPLRRGEVDVEFDQELLAELLDQLPFNMAIADLYKSRFRKAPGVLYTAGVQHAKNVAAAFREFGINAKAVSGETPKRELAETLAAFERGEVDVLCNAQLLAEGWNSPRATICMHLAPTASKRIYQQRVGRVTRRAPGKEAGLVIDFVHPRGRIPPQYTPFSSLKPWGWLLSSPDAFASGCPSSSESTFCDHAPGTPNVGVFGTVRCRAPSPAASVG